MTVTLLTQYSSIACSTALRTSGAELRRTSQTNKVARHGHAHGTYLEWVARKPACAAMGNVMPGNKLKSSGPSRVSASVKAGTLPNKLNQNKLRGSNCMRGKQSPTFLPRQSLGGRRRLRSRWGHSRRTLSFGCRTEIERIIAKAMCSEKSLQNCVTTPSPPEAIGLKEGLA